MAPNKTKVEKVAARSTKKRTTKKSVAVKKPSCVYCKIEPVESGIECDDCEKKIKSCKNCYKSKIFSCHQCGNEWDLHPECIKNIIGETPLLCGICGVNGSRCFDCVNLELKCQSCKTCGKSVCFSCYEDPASGQSCKDCWFYQCKSCNFANPSVCPEHLDTGHNHPILTISCMNPEEANISKSEKKSWPKFIVRFYKTDPRKIVGSLTINARNAYFCSPCEQLHLVDHAEEIRVFSIRYQHSIDYGNECVVNCC